MPAPSQTTHGTLALSASWLIAVSLGMAGLVSYAAEPGPADRSPARWPASSLPHAAGDTELLMFAHALCPCSQSSLSELERLLADLRPRPRCRIVLWTDAEQPERFADSPLRERAVNMTGVEVVEDPGGMIARRFGARTSGQLLVYGDDGRRLFAGGITPGRGHEGDSAGGLSVRELFASDATPAQTTPVFGCPLFEERVP
jgi:hypothetical protein